MNGFGAIWVLQYLASFFLKAVPRQCSIPHTASSRPSQASAFVSIKCFFSLRIAFISVFNCISLGVDVCGGAWEHWVAQHGCGICRSHGCCVSCMASYSNNWNGRHDLGGPWMRNWCCKQGRTCVTERPEGCDFSPLLHYNSSHRRSKTRGFAF